MFKGLLKQFLKKTAFMATCTSVLLVITTGAVQAAASCSITTNPANATIDEGQSVDFTGSITGKGKKTCDWTFSDGIPAGSTSDCLVSVTYASVGSYTATLDGTASKDGSCQDTVTVTVNAAQAPQCSDGIDNDGDTLIDFPADPGCDDAADNDETDTPLAQCEDGIDNDGDTLIDFPDDPGCDNAADNDETDAQVASAAMALITMAII